MDKQLFSFTKDYMEAIAQVGLFAYQRDERTMEADDVILGTWNFTKKYSFHHLFWKFIGWQDTNICPDLIQEEYGKIQKLPQHSRLKFKLNSVFQEKFLALKKKGLREYTFLVLLMVALQNISDEMRYYLTQRGVNVTKSIKKIQKIVMMLDQVKLATVDFFITLQKLMTSMGLKVEQMDTFIDVAQIQDLKDGKQITMQFSGSGDMGGAVEERGGDSSADMKDEEEKKLTIEYFATDLTGEAREGILDPVIGRDKEIDQLIYTLLRKTKNNPLLIGEAGVGKTAIVEGLAQKMINGQVPEKLRNKRIMMLDMGSLVAGTKYRGEFEARLKAITEEAMDPMNAIILFIDEIHTIIGAGNAEGSADAANILKPLLARGKLQLIGATTFDEYQKHIEKDAALKRRFQELNVDEPSREVSIDILMGIRERFEEFHGVNISDEAIEKAVAYSIRYMMNKHLPDKAIDIIDEACARLSTLQAKLVANDAYVKLEEKIKTYQKKIEKSIDKQDYFKAAELKEQEEEAKKKLKGMRQQHTLPRHLRPTVEVANIGQVLADKMGIPVDQITSSEIQKLAKLDTHLKTHILGQDDAVDAVVKSIRRNRLSAIQQQKPIGSFLFLGPSGVGKTYLGKLIAKDFFGDEKALIRVDMSEFMERHSSSKLIGSAPGYVGYEEGGILTEQVRRRPYSVILFDEIEKASPDILNVMLQLLDEGHLKDNKGRWIDFKNTIIIMTSNIGSEHFGKKLASIGFANKGDGKDTQTYAQKEFEVLRDKVLEQVKDRLKPELLNRLTAQIVFRPLDKITLTNIFKIRLKEFLDAWKQKEGIKIPRFSKTKIAKIIDEIYDSQFGARPIERYLVDKLESQFIQQMMDMETVSSGK